MCVPAHHLFIPATENLANQDVANEAIWSPNSFSFNMCTHTLLIFNFQMFNIAASFHIQ